MIKIMSKHKWWAKKLSYLISALRSGTTWLQAILASYPSVFSRPEAHTRPRNLLKERKTMVRIALIGCGAIAEQVHFPVLAGREDVSLLALVDKNLERARYYTKGYNVPYVANDISELPLEEIDAAVIATPPVYHAPLALKLISQGIHVLVEKPLALSYAEAEKIVALAEKKNVKVAVPLYRRLFPSFRLLVSLIKNNIFGLPLTFSLQGGGFYNWPAASLGNLKKELAGGGVLIDLGPHFLDFLFQIFNGPVELLEYRDDALGGIEADCVLKLRFYHQNRSMEGMVELARTRKLNGGLRIECEKAFIEFKPSERFKINIYPKESSHLEDFWDGSRKTFAYQALWKKMAEDESWFATFARVYDDWLGAIKENREPLLSAKSTLPIIRLIEECYRNHKPLKKSWVVPPKRTLEKVNHFKKRPKVLVTGATGFIGCRVAEILRLREGWDVRAVVRSPGKAARLARLDIEMVPFDLEQSSGFEELVKGCDAIIHCAVGTAYGDSKRIYRVTVDGTRKLAQAALKNNVDCFVHVSSMAVYGSKLSGLIDESKPVAPDPGSIYGETKLKAEQVIQNYVKKGLRAVIFRPARVFGPFGFTFVTNPLQAMADGRFAWLGDPNIPCDMIYVDNVVEAFVCALYANSREIAGEVFNLGEQNFMTWREFYGSFVKNLGLDVDLDAVPVVYKEEKSQVSLPMQFVKNLKEVFISPEFKSFMRKVIYTDPLGIAPRKILEIPKVKKVVKKIFKIEELPIYCQKSMPKSLVTLGSNSNAVLNIAKIKSQLGFGLVCSREEAILRTTDWINYSQVLNY